MTEVSEGAQVRPVTIQVTRTVNGLNLVQYADRALDLDRVPVEDVKVAAVNPQSVLERTKAGMRALATLKEYVSERKQQLLQNEEDLRKREKQLKEQWPKLSDAEKREKETQFRAEIQEYVKRAQGFNDELAHRQKELVQDYIEKIQNVTGRVASMSGIDLVLRNL